MEEKIKKAIQDALGAQDVTFVVERPGDLSHGDYTSNVALVAAKALGKNPRELADSLATTLRESLGELVSKIDVAGPGFINITLAREAVTLAIAEADSQKEGWGKGRVDAEKRVLIEYSDPNALKEMHIGNLVG